MLAPQIISVYLLYMHLMFVFSGGPCKQYPCPCDSPAVDSSPRFADVGNVQYSSSIFPVHIFTNSVTTYQFVYTACTRTWEASCKLRHV